MVWSIEVINPVASYLSIYLSILFMNLLYLYLSTLSICLSLLEAFDINIYVIEREEIAHVLVIVIIIVIIIVVFLVVIIESEGERFIYINMLFLASVESLPVHF